MPARKSRNKSGLTPSIINALKAKNWSQARIARAYNVTPQYVSWIKSHYGGIIESPSETAKTLWPWKVESRFHWSSVNARLRDHLKFAAGKSEDISEERWVLLQNFYKRLREGDLVVEYDPNIPPSEGISTGGWAFRPRLESDDDLIIRVNEYTNLSDEGEFVWVLPPELPG